jgi:MltA specific insert domain
MVLLLCVSPAFAWDELGPEGVPTGRAYLASERFTLASEPPAEVSLPTSAQDLGAVARETARTIREAPPAAWSVGLFQELGVTLDDVLDTLDLVARRAEKDEGRRRQRLQDPRWVGRHFEVYRWSSDVEAARARQVELSSDEIRLTSYLVYQAPGSATRTPQFDTALYAVPTDEASGGPAGLRLQYDRPAVFAGVYEPGGAAAGLAEPLVWLTRRDVHRALMQGSIEVHHDDGRVQVYNVHQNNGIPYDPAQKDGDLQQRYWYFRAVTGILGVEGIPLRAHASVAGDIYNLGLGKLVGLTWSGASGPELHLAVLADTGGAFQPNLFQLDWLAGTFPDHDAYAAWEATMPRRVEAAVLLVVRPPRAVQVRKRSR